MMITKKYCKYDYLSFNYFYLCINFFATGTFTIFFYIYMMIFVLLKCEFALLYLCCVAA